MRREFRETEERWVKRWEDAGIFEADPIKGKKKIFVTFPFPYMNGPLHLGHAFTSTRCDVFARFKRMQGYNVLFPWSWHLTGEPIAGTAERVKRGDPAQIKIFKEIDGVSASALKKFEDPEYIANYYIKESKESVKRLGHSIDWRREFTTTSLHPQFNRFIEWQYLRLREKGYVSKGTHPVVWCSNCKSPTGDHDRLRGEGASPVEFILLKFKIDDSFLVAATLRPETIFGVTNMWLNPDSTLVKARIDGEKWVVSKEAAEKLREQKDNIKVLEEFSGEKLIGRKCGHPIGGKNMLILPASFVDPGNASGVVMSVPSHAPYDWMALKDLTESPIELQKYGITKDVLEKIKPISLIKISAFGEHPAIEICDRMKIKNQHDPKVEEATEIIYREEFYKGILRENTGKYSGMKVSEVKKKLVSDFAKAGVVDRMYELSEEVVCRCSNRCTVKILKDQWFLNFSDEKWKEKAMKALRDMSILPDDARANFEYTIGWLEAKACARKTGLGTPLPWDPEWTVETLSDSTIYMAFYTIAKHVNSYGIKGESLTPEVFDYIFYGKGNPEQLARKSDIKPEVLGEMREEFEYWMPVDFRNSAKELIPNHLTFYIFHHIALFPREKWPRCIGVNGMINIEGEKMSKSTGNFITLKKALKVHGADATRAALLYSADGLRDPDWREKAVIDMEKRISAFYEFASKIIGSKSTVNEKRFIDEWLLSRMQRHIKKATEECENMRTRSAFQASFFDLWKDVRWYIRRGKMNRKVMVEVLDIWVRLIAPYMPALAEDIWRMMGKKGFVSLAEWPKEDSTLISEDAEIAEELVVNTTEDIENILKVTGIKPKKIVLYTAEEWKWDVCRIAGGMERLSMKDVMAEVMKKEDLRKIGKDISRYVSELIKDPAKIKTGKIDEAKALNGALEFLRKEFKSKVEVYAGEDKAYDPLNKRRNAMPLKPAIYVE